MPDPGDVTVGPGDVTALGGATVANIGGEAPAALVGAYPPEGPGAGRGHCAISGAPICMGPRTAAAEAALSGASPRSGNAFKVELGKRTVARALSLVAGLPG
jgi:hypothetical protein